jgi:hypothetical protein
LRSLGEPAAKPKPKKRAPAKRAPAKRAATPKRKKDASS